MTRKKIKINFKVFNIPVPQTLYRSIHKFGENYHTLKRNQFCNTHNRTDIRTWVKCHCGRSDMRENVYNRIWTKLGLAGLPLTLHLTRLSSQRLQCNYNMNPGGHHQAPWLVPGGRWYDVHSSRRLGCGLVWKTSRSCHVCLDARDIWNFPLQLIQNHRKPDRLQSRKLNVILS